MTIFSNYLVSRDIIFLHQQRVICYAEREKNLPLLSEDVALFCYFATDIRLEAGCLVIAQNGPLNACVSGLSSSSLIFSTSRGICNSYCVFINLIVSCIFSHHWQYIPKWNTLNVPPTHHTPTRIRTGDRKFSTQATGMSGKKKICRETINNNIMR